MAAVKSALQGGAVVTCGTWSQAMLTKGLQHSHAYTVLDCDLEASTVTLRNPYGHGEPGHDGSDDGEFSLSFAAYMADFNSVTIETDRPASLSGKSTPA
jgi:hypothetical protein